MPPLLLLLLGLVLLIFGAEVLVRGASRLALTAGLSPLVVGLVVVSLGTSAPEASVTVDAAWRGQADLAVGNIVGSNTFNVLFILGLSALVAPLAVGGRLVRMDIPVMVGISLLLLALAANGAVVRWEGIAFLVIALAYLIFNVRLGRKEARSERRSEAEQKPVPDSRSDRRAFLLSIILTLVGVGVLVAGARFTVGGASELARSFGISELVIGLTVVAAGTSLPEVAASVLAAARGQRDIAVGNIVGSNILNIALILGLASTIAPQGLAVAPGALSFDLPVMVAAAIAVLPIAFTGQVIARWEGGVFVAYYVAYVTHLVLGATVHSARQEFAFAFQWFVLPLTAIALVAALVREMVRRRSQ